MDSGCYRLILLNHLCQVLGAPISLDKEIDLRLLEEIIYILDKSFNIQIGYATLPFFKLKLQSDIAYIQYSLEASNKFSTNDEDRLQIKRDYTIIDSKLSNVKLFFGKHIVRSKKLLAKGWPAVTEIGLLAYNEDNAYRLAIQYFLRQAYPLELLGYGRLNADDYGQAWWIVLSRQPDVLIYPSLLKTLAKKAITIP